MADPRLLFRRRAAAVVLAVLLVAAFRMAAEARPQAPVPVPPVQGVSFRLTDEVLAAAASEVPLTASPRAARQSAPGQGTFPRRTRPSSRTLRITWGVIGAAGGFLAGGLIGARLEGPCGCDDPGLQGFLIGAPIGAAAGGVLGATVLWKFF